MSKWTLKRFFALALTAMMILTVPEVSAAAVIDVEAEDAIVESTETNDVVEEETTGVLAGVEKGVTDDKEASSVSKTPISGVLELGTTETSAYSFSFFTETTDYVPLKSGNYEEWIDRIDVPDYALDFYDALVEGADNDGTDDILIDGATAVLPVVEVTCLLTELDAKAAEVSAIIRATYDAFDRDHPEVFWLSGDTFATYSGQEDGTNAYVTFYFALNTTINGEPFDVRATDYQSADAIKADITVRDNAISAIISGTGAPSGTDTVEWVTYFNEWLTENNAYCTAATHPALSYECLSALTGSTGATGPVCEAYARAFKILCNKKNVPCVLVDGYATYDGVNAEAHMWNYVQVGTNWYAVDVTWNDPGKSTEKVSGNENKDWLLLGSDTGVFYDGNNALWTFIESHPVSNCASYGGENFLNGPVLSADSYIYSDFEDAEILNDETVYGYDTDTVPTVNINLKDGATGTLTYEWSEVVLGEDDELYLVDIEGDVDVNTNTLPLGLDVGVYYCQVYYNNVEVYYAYALVDYKELTPTITGTATKIYDGTTEYTGSDLAIELSGKVGSDDVSATATYVYADANAGTGKTITATNIILSGDDKDNYFIDEEATITTTGTISPKDISGATVSLNKNELTYNGAEQTVIATVELNEKTLGVGTDYTVSGNTAKDVKDSAYTVTVTGKGNYTGTATATYTISYLDADVTVKYNNETTVANWYNNAVTITAEGYTISDTLDGTYSAKYVVETEGVTSNLKLYFKNAAGYITDAKAIDTINIDKTIPTDVAITVKEDVFRTLLNTITFGIFHIDTQTGTITATETGSGIEGYYYYIDKSGSTTVLTAEDLETKTFTKGASFTLNEEAKYVIYAYAKDNAGNKSGYICTNGIVIDKTAPEITNVVQPTADNGNLKDTSATIVFTASEAGYYYIFTGTDANATYTAAEIAENRAMTMVAGENTFTLNPFEPNSYHVVYIAVKDTAGNLSDVVTKIEFTTQKTLPTITTNPALAGTYGDSGVTLKVTPGVASVDGTTIEGSWTIPLTTENMDKPEVGTTKTYTVKFTPTETDKYGEVTVQVVPTIAKKDITVTVRDATRVFGTYNPPFMADAPDEDMVGDDTMTGDLGINRITCEATETSDVGTYTITTTANSKNYNVTIVDGTLTITKATVANPETIAKEYVYGLGSEGDVYITLGNLLPADNGGVIYSAKKVDDKAIIDKLACGENEVLYSVNNTGSNGDTATITVTATSKNYEDITITIKITLVDKLSVSAQGAVTTVGSLTYGDALSKLTFGEVTFVDTENNVVTGTIAWDTPDAKLDAGTHDVAWTFTPSNTGKYKVATGKVSVTVAKATPEVTTPTVDAITYNPSKTLADINLPTATNGTWSWKDESVVPTVGNEGYVAVFTPNDTANYNTVEKTVAVEVAKATPVVSVAPTAEAIVYGDTLADSTLTGGTVDTEGTWAWKDASIDPVVADSETTEYEVVFTPNDTNNYNTTTIKVKLVVEKAQWPVNAPADEMAADYDWDVVGKVELPEGWVWADEDADTELGFEEKVTAIANYVGEDKDNFVNLTKEINITRNVDAPHIEGDETTMGWEAIADEMADTDKEEVRVDMNGHSVVSGDALETLKEEDKTLVIVFKDEDGKEEYTWTIKGSDVEDGDVKALDMETELFAKDATDKPAIPETLVKEVTANAKDHKFLSLTHDGEFGFKATLTINVGAANAGKLATLYYYNEETGKLLETENIKVEVDAEGNISLTFEHASDYVLSIEDKVVEQEPGGTTTPGTTKPNTGDGVFGNIYFYITLLLAGGLAGYVGVRKKREA